MCLQNYIAFSFSSRTIRSFSSRSASKCSVFVSSGMTLLKHGLIHKKLAKAYTNWEITQKKTFKGRDNVENFVDLLKKPP